MSKRKIEVQAIETIYPEIEDGEFNPLDHADDHLLTLLGELEAARDRVSRACPRFVHAMRAWANMVKQLNDDSHELVDALLSRVGVSDMPERALRAVLARTERGETNSEPLWRDLSESAEAFYTERAKMVAIQAKVLNYLQYLESQQPEQDVPAAILTAMEKAEHFMPRKDRER